MRIVHSLRLLKTAVSRALYLRLCELAGRNPVVSSLTMGFLSTDPRLKLVYALLEEQGVKLDG